MSKVFNQQTKRKSYPIRLNVDVPHEDKTAGNFNLKQN